MRSCATAVAALLTVISIGYPAAAQQSPLLRLTLDDAMARAMAASHRLAEATAREAAAQGGLALRQAASRPTVVTTAGYSRTNHVVEFTVPSPTGAPRVLYPDVPNNFSSRLELRWAIYTGGRTDALERAARAEADAAGADIAVAQADLRLEVARAYWAVVTARVAADVLEQGVARSQAHVAETERRLLAGLIPPNETASARAQEARSRVLAIEARNQRDVSAAELARLIGVDADQSIEPTSELALPTAGLPSAPSAQASIDASLVAQVRADRRERRALEYRVLSGDQLRQAAAAGRRPTISLLGGVDYSRPNPRIFPRADRWDESWDAGVGVSWSLWDGGRTAAEVAQAAALTTAARQRLAEFDSVLAVELWQRSLEMDSAVAAVAAAEVGVAAAAEARRVVDERYRAGVIGQIEVLDAEFALLQAELDHTRAQAAVRLTEARWARAIGR